MRLLVIIILIFSFLTKAPVKERILTKEKCLLLRSILPILIIIHHCSGFLDVPFLNSDFGIAGGAIVGIFFFFSGYGMELKREKFSLKFIDLPLRIGNLLYQLIIPSIIFYSINLLLGNNIIDILIDDAIKKNLCILPYSWFITILCVLYIIFYISNKLSKEYFLYYLFGLMFMFHIACIKLNLPAYFYISNFAFFSGTVYKHIEEKIISYNFSVIKWLNIICLCLLTIFAMKFSDATRPIFRFLWTFSFMTLYALLPTIKGNRFWNYLSKIGLQVYLCQCISFAVISNNINNGLLRTILIIFLTIILAICVNYIYTKINFILKRICQYKN